MASGDPMGVLHVRRASSSPAGRDFRVTGTTPGNAIPVHDFDGSTAEYIYIDGRLDDGYAGGGLTLSGAMMASSATSGSAVIEAGFRRWDSSEDADSSKSYSLNSATVAANGTSGVRTAFTITFLDSEIDGLGAGEDFSIQVRRNPSDGSDDMVGDAELIISSWALHET